LQELKEVLQAMGQTIVAVEGSAGRAWQGEERSGIALDAIRSGRGRRVSTMGGKSEYDSHCDEDGADEAAYTGSRHSSRCASYRRSRHSRKSAFKEADLVKYTEDPSMEDLPEGFTLQPSNLRMQNPSLSSSEERCSTQRPFTPGLSNAWLLCAGWSSCPRCAELERQLQYWRQKGWYQKARDARWDKLKARRLDVSVNVNSKFAGRVVVEPPQTGTRMYAPSCCVHFSIQLNGLCS
jgi:hypothetical protein